MVYDCEACELTLEQQVEPEECPLCGAPMTPALFDDTVPQDPFDDEERPATSLRDAWLLEGLNLTAPIGLHSSVWSHGPRRHHTYRPFHP